MPDAICAARSHMIVALGHDEDTCQRLYKLADSFLSSAEARAVEAKRGSAE